MLGLHEVTANWFVSGVRFELLRLGKADLAEVAALEALIYAHPWTLDNFMGEFKRRITLPLGIKQDGRVVAYCFCWVMFPEIHLLNVAVSQECRCMGLGRKILGAMVHIGRRSKVESIFLEVRPNNNAALALYKSMGFFVAGRRLNYYEDGQDALLMTLDI